MRRLTLDESNATRDRIDVLPEASASDGLV